MSDIEIALIVYLVGYLASLVYGAIEIYRDWENGVDIKWGDIIVCIVASLLSWLLILIILLRSLEDVSSKVVIKGKSNEPQK